MSDIVLDLFSGCGGFSLGCEWAGLDVVAGVEFHEKIVDVYNENFSHRALQYDLAKTDPEEFEEAEHISDVDMIVGGPPCQGFSVANMNRDVDDERNNLVFRFAEYISHYEPDVFVMENVTGILSIDDGALFGRLLRELGKYGYSVDYETLCAVDYGVPQKRDRVFVVGVRDDVGRGPVFPSPSHGPEDRLDFLHPNIDDYCTVEDAISDLPSPTPSVLNHEAPNQEESTTERIRSTEQGESLYDSWGEKIRLDPSKPAPTLKGGESSSFHFAHPYEDRKLTVRERGRLQGFPDWFDFGDGLSIARRVTGNAVPPQLAKSVVEANVK